MSHVERAEAAGSPLGLVAVVLALLLICALTVVLVHFHRQGMARVRADRGGRLRLPDSLLFLSLRHTYTPCVRTAGRIERALRRPATLTPMIDLRRRKP